MDPKRMTRRDWMRVLGATGLATGAGALAGNEPAYADPAQRKDAPRGIRVAGPDHPPAILRDGKVIQPERQLTLLHETDVLVVGGAAGGR